jgi:hypothetical protein
MSITYDNSQLGSAAYTVGAGTNPYVLVVVADTDLGGNHGTCTFGGVPMDLVVTLGDAPSGSTYPAIFIFGLANPVQGSAQTVSATHAVFCVASYMGARSVYPVYQSQNGAPAAVQEIDMFITPDTSNSWALSCGGFYSSMVSALTIRQSNSGLYFGDSNGGGLPSPYEVAVNTQNLQYYQFCTFLLSTTPPPIRVPGTPAFLTRFM